MANIHHFAMSGLLVYCVGKFSPKEGLLTKVFYLFFGCICIIVLRHVLLCNISSGMTNTKAREMLDSGYRMPAPEGTPDEMYNLMLKCWNYEAESRPHFEEIHGKIEVQFSSNFNFYIQIHWLVNLRIVINLYQERYSATRLKNTSGFPLLPFLSHISIFAYIPTNVMIWQISNRIIML